MHGIGWGWWLVMSIGMVAFWALVVYGVVFLIRGQPADRREAAQESPEQILKRRLAEGEISIGEYERLHATIHPQSRKPAAA